MTIAPLPSLPVDAAAPGADAGTSSDASADTFAALVLAVLDAGAGAPWGAIAPGGNGSVTSGAEASEPPVLDPAGAPTGVDATVTESVSGSVSGSCERADEQPAGHAEGTDLAVVEAQAPAIVPVTLPAALAAALGLNPVPAADTTRTAGTAEGALAPTGGQGLKLLQATPSGPAGSGTSAAAATVLEPAPAGASSATSAVVQGPTDQSDPTGVPVVGQGHHTPSGPSTTTPQTTQPLPTALVTPAASAGPSGPGVPDATAAAQAVAAPSGAVEAQAVAAGSTAPATAIAAAAGTSAAARGTGARSTEPERASRADGTAPAPTFVQATTAPARAIEAAPTTQVTRTAAAQVVPELTRLVQAGPGTHRVVLRLDPEHLGEVRITLTVHPGGVRVRMATGSEDARTALTDGLHHLHRALETVPGRPAGDTQIAVLHQPRPQDGPAYDQGAGGGLDARTGDAQASPHQTPGDRPQADDRAGRPARTQVDTTARDGSQGGGTSGTPRPADPPTPWRSARLDVSM